MPRRIWWTQTWWTLCCIGLLTAACTSAPTVVAEPAETPTSPDPNAELTQDESDDAAAGRGVPFPPGENLVEYDAPSQILGNRQDLASAALGDPLAAGLVDTDRIDELLVGQWQLTFAEEVEPDRLPALPCDTDGSIARFESTGIDVSYGQNDGLTMTILIRQGPDIDALFDALIPSLGCAFPDVIDVDVATVGSEDQMAAAMLKTDELDFAAGHSPIVIATRGDVLVGANIGGRTADSALSDILGLAVLVSEILANTP